MLYNSKIQSTYVKLRKVYLKIFSPKSKYNIIFKRQELTVCNLRFITHISFLNKRYTCIYNIRDPIIIRASLALTPHRIFRPVFLLELFPCRFLSCCVLIARVQLWLITSGDWGFEMKASRYTGKDKKTNRRSPSSGIKPLSPSATSPSLLLTLLSSPSPLSRSLLTLRLLPPTPTASETNNGVKFIRLHIGTIKRQADRQPSERASGQSARQHKGRINFKYHILVPT